METSPSEQPRLLTVDGGGLRLAVWEWPGDGSPFVFAHAAGHHGRVWDRIARMFPERRRLAVELRGHGRSDKPEPPYRWTGFGADIAAVVRRLDLSNAIGVGHSLGGHALVQAAVRHQDTFAALLLIDPVISPPEYYGMPPVDASFILRRRARWESPDQMLKSFSARTPFAGWDPEILRDYCAFGLLPDNGEYVLACPPEAEASIYACANAPEARLVDAIAAVEAPVTVLRAGVEAVPGVFDLNASPTWPELAARFRKGRDRLIAGANHYLPMERPGAVAEEIRRCSEIS